MPELLAHSAFTRISHLAALRPVHEAFQWLHLQQKQMLDWQAAMVAIAAPPFGELPRAEWLRQRFIECGLSGVHTDALGNVLGFYPADIDRGVPDEVRPCVMLSAHIDTVFPAGTPLAPRIEGTRIEAPGACDNAAGVIGMLGIAAALRHASVKLGCDLLFAGNVGEEGEGDLRGIRYIYQHSQFARRIIANVVLDGAGNEVAVVHALGSRRFLVTIAGPGGHSWTNSGVPNPIIALSNAISALDRVELPREPRTTMNVGTIEGGTSVNAVPEEARARFDFRSSEPAQLDRLELELRRAVEAAVQAANKASEPNKTSQHGGLRFTIDKIGDRPAGHLRPDAPILEALRAVDRHLGIRTELRIGSTDANIPISLGIDALSLGAGGDGGGAHTRAEWYDSTNRELGLRRILLLVLALLESAAKLP